eukprot:m.139980 g.139980  ORF g.139980 m.139980 type:complete len:381 (+) comp25900_c0_seq1:107-1249(+)
MTVEKVVDPQSGKSFFIDLANRTTSWINPKEIHSQDAFVMTIEGDFMPPGWNKAYSDTVGDYYIDHNTWTTHLPEDLVQHLSKIETNKFVQFHERELNEMDQQHDKSDGFMKKLEMKQVTVQELKKAQVAHKGWGSSVAILNQQPRQYDERFNAESTLATTDVENSETTSDSNGTVTKVAANNEDDAVVEVIINDVSLYDDGAVAMVNDGEANNENDEEKVIISNSGEANNSIQSTIMITDSDSDTNEPMTPPKKTAASRLLAEEQSQEDVPSTPELKSLVDVEDVREVDALENAMSSEDSLQSWVDMQEKKIQIIFEHKSYVNQVILARKILKMEEMETQKRGIQKVASARASVRTKTRGFNELNDSLLTQNLSDVSSC